MDQKLSEKHCNFLRNNYCIIEEKVDIKTIIPILCSKNVIDRDKAISLSEEDTSNAECVEYVVHELLLNDGTYIDLKQIHLALKQKKQGEACKLLPSYDPSDDEESEEETQDSQGEVDMVRDAGLVQTMGKVAKQVKKITKKVMNDDIDGVIVRSEPTHNSNQEIFHGSEEETNSDEEVDVVRDAGAIQTVGKVVKKVKKFAKKALTDNSDTTDGVNLRNKPVYNSKQEMFHDAFEKYRPKSDQRPHGRGICVVFALFTGHLKGYNADLANLEKFFSGVLKYAFKSYENLTQKELFEKVKEVQQEIEKVGDYDRLFVVILSHGAEDGILTCANAKGWGKEVKQNSDELVKTEISQIVDEFKHNKLPSLKGMPKVFLVQACRGPAQNMVEAAADQSTKVDLEDKLPYKPQCPVDGDIMICYATTMDHPSLVNPEAGSWFVEDLLAVFEKHYKNHHVADMMTVTHLAIAERRGSLYLNKHQSIEALQMPCTWTSFRKMFYL